MKLNTEQQEAVNCREGAWLWLATAGSGKTTVLTERVKSLVMSGTPVNEILALTFTSEAAKNMSERVGLSLSKFDRYGFRTFHSFGLRVVEAEKDRLPFRLSENHWESLNGSKIFYQVCKERFGYKMSNREKKEAREFISKMKRTSVTLPDNFKKESVPTSQMHFMTLYHAYNERMQASGCIDYDDMVVLAVQLLEKPDIRARWQFKWVHCDEAQDTDNLQFRLLQLISERDKNVFVVGDINQSMYSFRGAVPENMERFAEWFPGAQTRILPENYRSTPEIVEFSRKAAPVKNDLVRNMRTSNPSGSTVEVTKYVGTAEEVNGVLAKCVALEAKCAVLARTNQQIGLFETACTEKGVKFHLLGKSGFWKTPEVRNIMGLCAFAISPDKPESYPQRLVDPHRKFLRGCTAGQAVDQIVVAAKLEELYANEDYDADDNFALDNLKTVISIAQRFPTLVDFLVFANRAAHASRKSKHAITLGTIHAAKGLEWENVFVVGVQEGKLPHDRGNMREEQCVYYVAVSRPAKRLFISYVGRHSRFLEENDGVLVHQ